MTEEIKVCYWLYDEDSGAYDTACDNTLLLNDGTPAENDFRFCPYCGKAIEVVEEGEKR